MSKFLLVCAVWLAAYFGPIATGEWYYSAFSLYQCSASLLILYFVLPMRKTNAWAAWLGCFCVIQILFHSGDFIFDYHYEHYNNMLDVLNACEAIVLFGFGGISTLYRWMTHGSDRASGHFSARVSTVQSRRISRGADGV